MNNVKQGGPGGSLCFLFVKSGYDTVEKTPKMCGKPQKIWKVLVYRQKSGIILYKFILEVGIVYQVGDKIVHPMHGAGVIDSIVSRKLNGVQRDYYQMRLPTGSMLVMIPTDHTDEIGVRPVMGPGEAAQVMAALCSIQVDMSQNWNRRYRENMVRLKSGDLLEVARVVKGLMLRDGERGLSTGERKMLHSARQILLSELVLAQDLSYQCASERLDEALA